MQDQVRSPSSILTLVELRVLEGLSRGASLPLDEALTIGNDASSDLLLMDDGVAPSHARISPTDDGFLLEVQATTGEAGSVRQLVLGEVFVLGAARLVCCKTDTPWDALFAAAARSSIPNATEASDAATAVRPHRLRLVLGMLTAMILAVVGLLWIASQQMTPAPTSAVQAAPRPLVDADALAQWAHEIERRLQAADLPGLEARGHQGLVRISGTAPGTALPRLERVLKTARRERTDIQIVLQLEEALPEPLPFRVKALVGGPFPRALLDDDVILYPGERHAGVLLVSINGTCLTLMRGIEQQRTQVCLDQIRQPS